MLEGKLVEMLKRHEGYRDKPYLCSQGFTTIGYGRNLDAVGITREEAQQMLEHDIYTAVVELDKYQWFMLLDKVRQDALTDFMFNVGAATFAQFKLMIAALQKGDYQEASKQLLDSRYAKQVGDRAQEIAYMIRTGKYRS